MANIRSKTLWRINFLLAIVAIALGYWVYTLKKERVLNLIPENALCLIQLPTVIDSTALNMSLLKAPFFSESQKLLIELTANFDLEEKEIFKNSNVTISVHQESKNELGQIAYIKLDGKKVDQIAKALVRGDNLFFEQEYSNRIITKVSDTFGKYLFGFIRQNDFLIISKSNLLLELVIDQISKPKTQPKYNWNVKLEDQSARIFFPSDNLRSIELLFPKELSQNYLNYLKVGLPINPEFVFTAMDTSFSQSSGILVGKRTASDGLKNIFQNQQGKPWTNLEALPLSSSVIIRVSLSNPQQFFKDQFDFLSKKKIPATAKRDSLQTYLNFNSEQFYKLIGDEIIYLEMENVAFGEKQKVLLLESKNVVLMEDFLKKISIEANKIRRPIIKSSLNYNGYFIQNLNAPNWLSGVMGPIYEGFDEVTFTKKGNYILFANSDKAMVNYINQVEAKQNWKVERETESIFNNLDSTAVLSSIISPKKTWRSIIRSIPDEWKNGLKSQENSFKSIDIMALEHFPDLRPSKVLLKHNTNNTNFRNGQWEQQEQMGFTLDQFIEFNEDYLLGIANGKAVATINKVDKSLAFSKRSNLSRLSNYKFYDFLQTGQSELLVLDGMVCYLFSINSSGQLAERTLFRHFVPIQSFDVNESGIYFLDNIGDIYFYNRSNFTTKKVDLKTRINNPFSIATLNDKGIEKLIVAEKGGDIHQIYASSGIELKNYPQNILNAKLAELLIRKEQGLTNVRGFSKTGIFQNFNIDKAEKVGSAIQLERGSKFLSFEILWDVSKTDWLIVRRSKDDILVMDQSGKKIVEIEQPYGIPIKIAWYDCGEDNKFLSIFDGQKTQIYDLLGQKIGTMDFESEGLPFLYIDKTTNELVLFSPAKQKLEIWTIKSK